VMWLTGSVALGGWIPARLWSSVVWFGLVHELHVPNSQFPGVKFPACSTHCPRATETVDISLSPSGMSISPLRPRRCWLLMGGLQRTFRNIWFCGDEPWFVYLVSNDSRVPNLLRRYVVLSPGGELEIIGLVWFGLHQPV